MLRKLDHGCLLPWTFKKDANEKLNDVQTDFVPRDYQIEMLNRAKKENTIVMMPTGTGKTFVAVLLIKHFIHQVMTDPWRGPCAENSSCGNGKCSCGNKSWRRTFFLVNQVTLVSQQKRVLERHTGVAVGEYSGTHSKSIDTWDKKRWFYEFKLNQILVMTTDLFKNLLSTGILKTDHVNVLVLDECHHAKDNHPMASVMRDFWNTEKPDGRVLGLTASVIDKKKVGGKAELRLSIEKLQQILNSRLVTPLEFVNQIKDVELPDPSIHVYSPRQYASELSVITDNLCGTINAHSLKSLPDEEKSTYNHIKKIVTAIPVIISEVGIDGLGILLEDDKGFIAEISNCLANCNVSPKRNNDGVMEECLTYRIGQAVLKQLECLKKSVQLIIEECREVRMSVKFYELLKYILRLQHNSSENGTDAPRIIVFIQRRRVVIAMHKYLCKLRKEVEGCANIKACYVLGGTTGSSKDEDESKLSDFEVDYLETIKKQQEQALIDFREGKHNILLATSVVEEGLDIPACNIVIRYDFPQTYRAYVQSRGRARKKPAKFVFFMKETEKNEKMRLLGSFHDIEILLREYASDMSPRADHQEDDDDDEFNYNKLIPPLEVEGTGAKVTANLAIQRLNFYCSQLPKDDYTDVMPSDYTIEDARGFKTTITLPKLCPVKIPIEGQYMPNKKLAKMSAAMKTLEFLYSAHELTDTLLPKFRQKEVNPLLIQSESGRSLTVDQKLKIPSAFWRRDLKEASGKFYLYSIRLHLIPNDPNFDEYFVDGKDHKVVCFGILCKERLPQFPLFTVYPRFGSVTVNIQFERAVTVPIHVLQSYYWFQEALFTHLLDLNHVTKSSDAIFKSYFILPLCWKSKGLQFRSSDKKSCFLDIDSRFIAQLHKQWDYETNRWIFGNMPDDLDKCLDSVIFPAYNKDLRNQCNKNLSGYFYAVIRKSELTPKDKMRGRSVKNLDDLETQTYEEYHYAKHDIKLVHPTKNLLECRNVTRHYAFLTEHASKKLNRPPMFLIGEIHQVHPMPSSLWSQATCLPSILWRIETFCLSNELTDNVYKGCNLKIDLLASHESNYFNERTDNLMARLRRDLEYKGDIDWFETLHSITHKSCGEEYNLERLEFLGDRFLKFVSTLYYYRTMPDKHEGWLSRYRSEMISNQNLAVRSCKEIELPRYILNKKVDPKSNWIPPCFLSTHTLNKISEAQNTVDSVSKEAREYLELLQNSTEDIEIPEGYIDEIKLLKKARPFLEVGHFLMSTSNYNSDSDALEKLCDIIPVGHLQEMGTKDVADSMEALLGLCVARYGYRKGVDLLDRIKVTTFQAQSEAEPDDLNNHLYKQTPPSQISNLNPVAIRLARSRCDNLRTVEKAIGYEFKEPLYLLEALTHASFTEIDACYQRLEFLGDAVLDVLMVFRIYEDHPEYDQGQMTDLLSSLVCNTTLSKVCTKLQLHKSLLYDSAELFNVLAGFFMNFEKDQLEQWCKDLSLERVFVDTVDCDTPDKIPILNLDNKVVQAPKLLGDLVESVIGAIYLDCDEDILRVNEVIWPWFEPFYTAFSKNVPKNPKAMINELYSGAIKKSIVSYPGDHYRSIATVSISIRHDDDQNKATTYTFKTVGRDRETAMEVSYGRALHFHKKFLAKMTLP
ncbi:hypothetical protein ACHWQZ_G011113 [Mnemiopsis leidyi]